MAHIQFFAMIYRIHLWFDWVPSKQNPGDPFSRPTTCGKEATFSLQLTKWLLCVAAVYAPQRAVTAILVEQRAKTMHTVESPVCALRIRPGALTIAVKQDGRWYNIVKCPLANEHRHMTAYLGTNQEVLRAKQRMQFKSSGFSLRFLD